ncbi:MAG TPA: hypothetical protein VKZ58_07100 [Longimicrobiales bacterium]|nr:hypothetical protein [Longimicrobiales bacterium]
MRRGAVFAASLGLVVSACAYFNSLYNAKRHFAEAERAAAQGNPGAAYASYGLALEKAAKSLRQSPQGRWADDALFLIARSHFGRSDYPAARAALQRLVAETGDKRIRMGAHAYLGATEYRLANYHAAILHLDAAVEGGGGSGDMLAFAHLWRARARFAIGDDDGGWADLEAASSAKGPIAREARIESARRSVEGDDTERARAAFATLLADANAHTFADSMRRLAGVAAARWGPNPARALLEGAADAPWPLTRRLVLTLYAGELAAAAGDMDAAEKAVDAVLSAATGSIVDRARILRAKWQLARATDMAALDDARATLLAAVADPEARTMLRNMRAVAVLLEHAQRTGQPLALFAAAELARDELEAPGLARQLFIAYADVVPDATWAPKALLAAADLAPSAEELAAIRERLAGSRDNVYLAALERRDRGVDFEEAEQRLSRTLGALRELAMAEADQRDAGVARAIALLDSARLAARTDSLEIACGALIDSLGIVGIRSDSVRAACMRADTVAIDSFLRVDTLLLIDTTQVRTDSLRLDTIRGGSR